jgi:hypothetical protein
MDEIGLKDAIAAVREELVQSVLAGDGHPLRFPVESIELTFQVGVTRDETRHGKVILKVLELGRERRHEEQSVHIVTLNLGAPVGPTGETYKVIKEEPRSPEQPAEKRSSKI